MWVLIAIVKCGLVLVSCETICLKILPSTVLPYWCATAACLSVVVPQGLLRLVYCFGLKLLVASPLVI